MYMRTHLHTHTHTHTYINTRDSFTILVREDYSHTHTHLTYIHEVSAKEVFQNLPMRLKASYICLLQKAYMR